MPTYAKLVYTLKESTEGGNFAKFQVWHQDPVLTRSNDNGFTPNSTEDIHGSVGSVNRPEIRVTPSACVVYLRGTDPEFNDQEATFSTGTRSNWKETIAGLLERHCAQFPLVFAPSEPMVKLIPSIHVDGDCHTISDPSGFVVAHYEAIQRKNWLIIFPHSFFGDHKIQSFTQDKRGLRLAWRESYHLAIHRASRDGGRLVEFGRDALECPVCADMHGSDPEVFLAAFDRCLVDAWLDCAKPSKKGVSSTPIPPEILASIPADAVWVGREDVAEGAAK